MLIDKLPMSVKRWWYRHKYRQDFKTIKTPQAVFRAAFRYGLYDTRFFNTGVFEDIVFGFYVQKNYMCGALSTLLEEGMISKELHERCKQEIYAFMHDISPDSYAAFMFTAVHDAIDAQTDSQNGITANEQVSRVIRKIYHNWDDRYETIDRYLPTRSKSA